MHGALHVRAATLDRGRDFRQQPVLRRGDQHSDRADAHAVLLHPRALLPAWGGLVISAPWTCYTAHDPGHRQTTMLRRLTTLPPLLLASLPAAASAALRFQCDATLGARRRTCTPPDNARPRPRHRRGRQAGLALRWRRSQPGHGPPGRLRAPGQAERGVGIARHPDRAGRQQRLARPGLGGLRIRVERGDARVRTLPQAARRHPG